MVMSDTKLRAVAYTALVPISIACWFVIRWALIKAASVIGPYF